MIYPDFSRLGQPKSAWRVGVRSAFTLVELLIAMTITLLLMAALARSFSSIGKSINSGRAQVNLSSSLRDISFRLRTDLRSRTAKADPPASAIGGQGYLTYYEGPLTDSSYGLYGAAPVRTLRDGTQAFQFDPRDTTDNNNTDASFNNANAGPTYRQFARYGDFDDYLAFTAEAPDGEWFTGKVPAYLLMTSTDTDNNGTVDATEQAAAMAPVIIRSKQAEIITWCSPKWSVDPTTNLLNLSATNSGMPLFEDEDNDLVPDEIRLHQRILLIRPDLNLRRTLFSGTNTQFSSDVLRPMNNSTNPDAIPDALGRVYPIGEMNSAVSAPAPASLYGSYAVTGSATDNRQMLNSNWLVGMAPLHQFYDLSLRRVIHPRTGEPTGYVAANSLEDLVQPHNRFASVRYPGRYFDRGDFNSTDASSDDATSMPLLAVASNFTLFNWQGAQDPRAEVSTAAAPAWFPNGPSSSWTRNTAGTATTADDRLTGLFNGWLLPHFQLGDPSPAGTSSGDHWERGILAAADGRWDRTGEDVIASGITAFDIRGFDETAPVFMTSGPDGEPGKDGVDDDASGASDTTDVIGTDALTELGAFGSDDQIVHASDIGSFELMGQAILHPAETTTYDNVGTVATYYGLSSQGAFVDLAYPYLAGSGLRSRVGDTFNRSTPFTAGAANAQVETNFNLFMESQLSAYPIPAPAAQPAPHAGTPVGMDGLKRSGKLVHFGSSTQLAYFQPTYDTWTDFYESDGFDQTATLNANVTVGPFVGTTWVLNEFSNNGIRPRLSRAAPEAVLQVDTGKLLSTQSETSAPFEVALPAISIGIRVVDEGTEEITEFTIVEYLQD